MFTPVIISQVLLYISALVTVGFTIYKFYNKKISKKTFLVFVFYSVIMCLYGISFIFYNPFLQYSPLHIISIVFFIYSGFILLYVKKHRKVIMWGIFAFYVLFNLLRIPYLWIYEGYTIYSILPLHICGISGLFMIARPFYLRGKSRFTKTLSKLLDNYLVCFAFLGALINVFFPPSHGFDLDFFNLRTFVSNVLHWSFFTVSIYYLLSGEIKPNKKMAIMNLFWLVPAYIMFIFLNSFFASNFFFTNSTGNPILFLFNLFPMWEWSLGNSIIEVNPIYWATVLGASILILFLITFLYELIDKIFVAKK